MIVSTPDVDTAAGHVAEMYQADLREDGFVFAHTRAMAVNPEAHQAFEALIGTTAYEPPILASASMASLSPASATSTLVPLEQPYA